MARSQSKRKAVGALIAALVLVILSVAQVAAAPAYHGGSWDYGKQRDSYGMSYKSDMYKHHRVIKKHVKKHVKKHFHKHAKKHVMRHGWTY